MGKSTLIKDFLSTWTNYTEVTLGYRNKIQESLGKTKDGEDYRSITMLGNGPMQEVIRDSVIDDISGYTREDNVIYDRGLFDNLAYSLYLCGQNIEGCDGKWLHEQLPIIKESMALYDLILFVPLLDGYSTPEIEDGQDGDRSIIFRSEVDNLMKAMHKEYLDAKRNWLPKENCPAIVEIFGTPQERIEMIKLYINENGVPYGEDNSLISEHLEEGLQFMQDYTELDASTPAKK